MPHDTLSAASADAWIDEGDPRSPLWLIGEAPGDTEVARKRPFTGPSGALLDGVLRDVGINRRDCYLTNICHEQPPPYTDKHGKTQRNDIDQFFAGVRAGKAAGLPLHHGRYPRHPITHGMARLDHQLRTHRPAVVVAMGNTPLWALAGEVGITKWRGSVLRSAFGTSAVGAATAVLATFHPADCLANRSPQHRPILCHDLERATRVLANPHLAEPPQWHFTTEPDLEQVLAWLDGYSTHNQCGPICDIETRSNQIACLGLSSSATRAICIPFMRASPQAHGYSYWSPAEEERIVLALRSFLTTHPVTFHNGLFDCQYIARQWGFLPNIADDTMVMQHVAFPGFLGGKIDPVSGRVDKRGSGLSLSFLASLYCERYRFWKDDGRLFDPVEHDERQLWHYNCEDCCRTLECRTALHAILERDRLCDQYRFEMSLFPHVLRMMFRGIRADAPAMQRMHHAVIADRDAQRRWLDAATGTDFNPESTPQMRSLFYTDLECQPIRNKKTQALTLDDHALDTIQRRTPLLRPLVERIRHYRTLDTIKDDLDVSRLSDDGRLRTALNPAYVETFRFSSNRTAFDEGYNLQNVPRPDEE